MITPPAELVSNMNSKTRRPTANIKTAWDNVLKDGSWFQLDQSALDSNAFLTLETYLDGETVAEAINEADNFLYSDDSDDIIYAEGFAELSGDMDQVASADMDIVLDNANNRYTPKYNKNKLDNPGFEHSLRSWNFVRGASGIIDIDEDTVRDGIRSMKFINSASETIYAFSNIISLANENLIMAAEDAPLTTAEDWVFSGYFRGSGSARISLLAFDATNKDANDITTGLISYDEYSITLGNADWSREEITHLLPIGSVYVRVLIELTGTEMYADDTQLERGSVATDLEPFFIGDKLLPKRPLKLQVGFNDSFVPKFSGLINKINPDINTDTVHIYSYDWIDRMKDVQITSQLFQNKRTDELISELADLAGVASQSRSLEVGTKSVELAWFPEASAWTYMSQVAEAEGGLIFFDEEGRLTFWNADHIEDNISNVAFDFTMDSHIMSIDYEISKSRIKNKIIIKSEPKKLLGNTILYALETSVMISPGETTEFWMQFSHGDEISVPAIDVLTPALGTEILGNAASNGSGADKTSDLEITSTSSFNESFKANIKNNGTSDVYVTKAEVYGKPIVIKERLNIEVSDQSSISLYDEQILPIENNLLEDSTYLTNLANQLLRYKKNPRNFMKVKVIGVPYLQLRDVVSLETDFDGSLDYFHVVENQWSIQGDFIQTLRLEK